MELTIKNREGAERFIEENEGLLKILARDIFEQHVTAADYDDVYADCILAVYTVFERGVCASSNETAYIAQAVKNIAKQTLWDFHRGASMSYNTMRAKRRKTGEIPVEVHPYRSGDLSNFGLELNEDLLKSYKRQTDDEYWTSPEDVCIHRDDKERLVKAKECLNKDESFIIDLFYSDSDKKVSLDKASEQCGMARSTLYFQKQRAIKKMRVYFDIKVN